MGSNAASQTYNEAFIHAQNITPPDENGKPVFRGLSNARVKHATRFAPWTASAPTTRKMAI